MQCTITMTKPSSESKTAKRIWKSAERRSVMARTADIHVRASRGRTTQELHSDALQDETGAGVRQSTLKQFVTSQHCIIFIMLSYLALAKIKAVLKTGLLFLCNCKKVENNIPNTMSKQTSTCPWKLPTLLAYLMSSLTMRKHTKRHNKQFCYCHKQKHTSIICGYICSEFTYIYMHVCLGWFTQTREELVPQEREGRARVSSWGNKCNEAETECKDNREEEKEGQKQRQRKKESGDVIPWSMLLLPLCCPRFAFFIYIEWTRITNLTGTLAQLDYILSSNSSYCRGGLSTCR